MSDTVNGKHVNRCYNTIGDSSGVLLQEGDIVLYTSNARDSDLVLKKVLKLN